MSRRASAGRTPAREPDAAIDEQGRPSRSQKKRDSLAAQALGEALAGLPPSRLAQIPMDDALRAAFDELARTRSHEGRRRQLQYVGKVMRGLDVEPLRQALAAEQLGGARASLDLHEAEQWRTRMLAPGGDEVLTQWSSRHPRADLQRLRRLVRQARTELQAESAPGVAQRQGRSYRELFRLLREAAAAASDERDEDPDDPGAPRSLAAIDIVDDHAR